MYKTIRINTHENLVADTIFYKYNQNMIYTDSHCHIRPEPENPDIACRIYNSARAIDWENAIDISERDDDKNFATIGIHPWYIADAGAEFETAIAEILASHPNLMVGEIGLDKFKPDMDRQVEVFTRQLEIAARFRRPIHLHCVGAWDKVLHIFREHERNMPPAVLAHGFTGDPSQIEMLANKYNMYFSYSVRADNETNATRVSKTPANRILAETDTFDAGEEISDLDTIINMIAAAHNYDADEMSEQIYQNIQRIISYVRPIA